MLLPLPIEARISLAVLSHPVVDMLGEHGITKNWIKKEVALHAAIIIAAMMSGLTTLAVLGILSANIIDAMDKIVFRRFLGHEVIHTSRIYPKVMISFTEIQTQVLNVLSVILTIFYLLG